ncbi:MAG: hypothetical protein OJF48_003676 [Afipia sp.]|jgi:hypothetical protein|nr:MAG: hypothetical protein OJF48_003676 [Afipia sp.]
MAVTGAGKLNKAEHAATFRARIVDNEDYMMNFYAIAKSKVSSAG